MTLPRCSIARFMLYVCVVAVNLAGAREVNLNEDLSIRLRLILLGALPLASLLALASPGLLAASTGRGGGRPFLIGFEGVGWAMVLVHTGCAVLAPEPFANVLQGYIDLLINDGNGIWLGWTRVVVVAFLLLLPPLSVALIGGWLHRTFEVRVSVRRRRATDSRAAGPSGWQGDALPNVLRPLM